MLAFFRLITWMGAKKMCRGTNNSEDTGIGMIWSLNGVKQVRFVATALALSISMTTLAQKNGSTIEEPPTTNKATDGKISTCSKSIAPSKQYSQQHFNQLRRELLDDRADIIDWWLASLAVILGFFGIVAVLGGYIGFRRFREIEVEARNSVDAARQHEEAARNHAKRIEELGREAAETAQRLRSVTAEYAAQNPNEVSQAVIDAQKNPKSSLIERAIASALSLQQKGKENEAIEKWHAVATVANDIDNDVAASAWFSIGFLVQDLKDLDGCIDAYSHAIQLKPDLAEAFNNRGNAKGGLGQHAEAIADFDQAIRLKPDFAIFYSNRAVAKGNLGHHKEAIADYDQAIRLNPNLAEAFNNRGKAKGGLGQYAEAIADFDQAVRLNPDLADAFLERGVAKGKLGLHKEAISDYDQVIKLKPHSGRTYLDRGWNKASSGDKQGARSDYEFALQLARESSNAELETLVEQEIQKIAGDID